MPDPLRAKRRILSGTPGLGAGLPSPGGNDVACVDRGRSHTDPFQRLRLATPPHYHCRPTQSGAVLFHQGETMLRNFLASMLLVAGAAAATHAQPSLPSSFRATTIHSPEGAD